MVSGEEDGDVSTTAIAQWIGTSSTLLAVDKSHDRGVIGFGERVLLGNVHNKRVCHAHSGSMS